MQTYRSGPKLDHFLFVLKIIPRFLRVLTDRSTD